eukprot:TRINITY_DN4653_c0_g1_i3.p1 TRINITY_DN4653_c0_g1~~TRINITY_DN4653_c0_g1_i3.p1  ORF type:complete len:611 (+),score=125.89 TRINITY_DN4653_c0_g1_i3:1796-3628(+)
MNQTSFLADFSEIDDAREVFLRTALTGLAKKSALKSTLNLPMIADCALRFGSKLLIELSTFVNSLRLQRVLGLVKVTNCPAEVETSLISSLRRIICDLRGKVLKMVPNGSLDDCLVEAMSITNVLDALPFKSSIFIPLRNLWETDSAYSVSILNEVCPIWSMKLATGFSDLRRQTMNFQSSVARDGKRWAAMIENFGNLSKMTPHDVYGFIFANKVSNDFDIPKPLTMQLRPFRLQENKEIVESLIFAEVLLTTRLLKAFNLTKAKCATYVCLDDLVKPIRYKDVVKRKCRETVLYLIHRNSIHFTLDYSNVHKIPEFDLWTLTHRSATEETLLGAAHEISTQVREQVISIIFEMSGSCLGGMVLGLILEYEGDLNGNYGQVIVQSGSNQDWNQFLHPILFEKLEKLGSVSDEGKVLQVNIFRCMFTGVDGTRGLLCNDWGLMESEELWERTRKSLWSKKISMMPMLEEMVTASSDEQKSEDSLPCWKYFSSIDPVTVVRHINEFTIKTHYLRMRSKHAFDMLLEDCKQSQGTIVSIGGLRFLRFPQVFQHVSDVSLTEGSLCTDEVVVEYVYGELLAEVSVEGKCLGMRYRCQPLFSSVHSESFSLSGR